MAPRRLSPIEHPVTLTVDGRAVIADEGEPVAIALAAAGRLTLGRSVKYHRPRGAVCYAGRCDGCLMRVDGVASTMTCRVPAREGLRVETQNVLGSAKVDLLAATDWFFPGGMNHHEMFTWNEAVNKVMQKVARRVAGIGRVPDDVTEPVAVVDLEVDTLVIGAGPAGLTVAAELAKAGKRVHVIDEETEPGGSLRLWPARVRVEGRPTHPSTVVERMVQRCTSGGVTFHQTTGALAVYDPREAADPSPALDRRIVLADRTDGAIRFMPRRLVIAPGRHRAIPPFSDSDTPGVIEWAAAARMLHGGVLPGERVLVAIAESEDPAPVVALVEALKTHGAEIHGPLALEAIVDVVGRPELSGCTVEVGGTRSKLDCDSIVVCGPSSAVYELASQAGVGVRFGEGGFELDVGANGSTASDDVFVVGGAAGVIGLEACVAHAKRAAEAMR
ncbi:MAG: 2Fe-2S iron-sulfur cluster-binding protein [Sandaracinaceae bacterium]